MDVYLHYNKNQPREVHKKSPFSQIGVHYVRVREEIETTFLIQKLLKTSLPHQRCIVKTKIWQTA